MSTKLLKTFFHKEKEIILASGLFILLTINYLLLINTIVTNVEAHNSNDINQNITNEQNILDLNTGLFANELKKLNQHKNSAIFQMPFNEEELSNKGEVIELGQNFSNYTRYYSGKNADQVKETTASLHGGLDFRVPEGTPVYLIKAGKVTAHLCPKYHTSLHVVEVDSNGHPNGREWGYTHIDSNSIPEEIINAKDKGIILEEGAYIGKIVKWLNGEDFCPDQIDISDNKLFNHLHLDMKCKIKQTKVKSNLNQDENDDDNGCNTQEIAYDIAPFFDFHRKTQPVIDTIYLLNPKTKKVILSDNIRSRNRGVENLQKKSIPKINGNITVAIDAYDVMEKSPFKNGIYQAEIEIMAINTDSNKNESKDMHFNQERSDRIFYTCKTPTFNRIESKTQNKIIEKLYLNYIIMKNVNNKSNVIIHSRGDRFGRKSFLNLTSKFTNENDKDNGFVDTRKYSNGLYQINISVSNNAGVKITEKMIVEISN
ncbi:MAG: hypothetical protein HQK49_22780 [Oligoflexia bacterium]|nr:hypothetical protein [Oligoflexia bacterium]